MVDFIIKFLLWIALPLYPLVLSFLFWFVWYTVKGRRLKRGVSRYKKPSMLRRIYIDFPNRFWLDKFDLDPNDFRENGLHLFCGEQGSGKTTAVVHLLMKLQAQYPKIVVRTNFNYIHQSAEVCEWRELVKNENGTFGQVEVIDEIQTWFSSMQSRDFPPEMLTEISQQRKQRKMLVGTAQVFGRVAKPIREQVSRVYCPFTIAGCLTIVRITKPDYYDDEKCRFTRYNGLYFFVHSAEIRNAFDTYKKIDGMVKSGFVPSSERFDRREPVSVKLKP